MRYSMTQFTRTIPVFFQVYLASLNFLSKTSSITGILKVPYFRDKAISFVRVCYSCMDAIRKFVGVESLGSHKPCRHRRQYPVATGIHE